jgi:acyl-CoA oxidase
MLTPAFWQLHTDPIWSMDGAAGTLCTLQLNCCIGTLLALGRGRKDIEAVVDQMLQFAIS